MDKLDFILARQTLIMKTLANIIPGNSRVSKIMNEWDSLSKAFQESENGTDNSVK